MKVGSDIRFKGPHKGTTKGARYNWIASAWSKFPDVIYIREHRIWKNKSEAKIIKTIIRCCNHEPIHNILWRDGLDDYTTYDIIEFRFGKKYKSVKQVI